MIALNSFYIGESVNFMKENIPNDFVDLTLTSPPYDNLRKYNGFIFDYKATLDELYRVTKNGGTVVWVVGDKTVKGSETLTSFKQALYAKEIGFNIHDTMIYGKNNPFGTCGNPPLRYSQSFEYIFILTKGRIKTFNPIKVSCKKAGTTTTLTTRKNRQSDGLPFDYLRAKTDTVKETKIKSNIWMYDTGNNKSTKDKLAFNHPATFPEQLAEDMLLSYSNENDIVLDSMCGSGTTCKQSYLNKRNFIGVDMSEQYINNICKPRLKDFGWNQKEENKECCKWCDYCFITDLETNKGTCDLDIGEHVKLTDDSCSSYIYNDDLNRC